MNSDVKLDEWTGLTEAQRRETVLRWLAEDHWAIYETLASESTELLSKMVSKVPGVTAVEMVGGDVLDMGRDGRAWCELVLEVRTALPESASLPEIPGEFCGFRVRLSHLGDKREAFLSTWKRLFKELRGWTESETLRWAEKWDDALSGRKPSVIYDHGPVRVALHALVDEAAVKKVGGRLGELYRAIAQTVGRPHGQAAWIRHPDRVKDYDWSYIRHRVQELVEEYSRPGGPRAPQCDKGAQSSHDRTAK